MIINTATMRNAIPALNQLPVRRRTRIATIVAGRNVIKLPMMNMMIKSPITTRTANTSIPNKPISIIIILYPERYESNRPLLIHFGILAKVHTRSTFENGNAGENHLIVTLHCGNQG
jgi:hypothetical protein